MGNNVKRRKGVVEGHRRTVGIMLKGRKGLVEIHRRTCWERC